MLSKDLAQTIVGRTMAILGKNINIMGTDGVILASGDSSRVGTFHEGALNAVKLRRVIEIGQYEAVTMIGPEIRHLPGSGAAGGLGGGLVAFLEGSLRRGVELVFDVLKFEEILARGADLVITGEGEINGQSIFGKVPVGVARAAKKHNLPVLALVGSIGPGAEKVLTEGIDAVMSIVPGPMSLEEAIKQAPALVEDAAGRAVRIINIWPNTI